MFGIDFAAIFKIIGIDLMLGADNAVVIALACAALPLALRNRALLLGTAGAVLLRAVLLAIAVYIMGLSFIHAVGGLFLFYVGYSLLSLEADEDDPTKQSTTVLAAVWTIIVADLIMSVDNVLAVAGAAQSAGTHATLYAIAGIVFSIPVIVFGAKYLTSLMDKFPVIIWSGAGLLGWVGAEMVITEPLLTEYIPTGSDIYFKIAGFVSVILAVIVGRHIKAAKVRSELAA